MITMSEQQQRQWFSREELAPLLRSAVGVFDHLEIETVRKIKSGRQTMERTAVLTEDLQKMIALLEDLFPGTLDAYINLRLEVQAERREAKYRGR